MNPTIRTPRIALVALFAVCAVAMSAIAFGQLGPGGECGSIASPKSPGNDESVGCGSFRSSRTGLFIGVSGVAAATVLGLTYLVVQDTGRDTNDREWRRKLEV